MRLSFERMEERLVLAGIGTPIITFPPAVDIYQSQSPPIVINAGATLTDSTWNVSWAFDPGNLTVQITGNADANDLLVIGNQGMGNGQIGVSGSTITYSGATIGKFTGGAGATPLVITFNSIPFFDPNVDVTIAQALIRDIEYESTSPVPPTAARTVTFTITDSSPTGVFGAPAGATSAPVTQQIQIVDVDVAPTVTIPTTPITFTTNSAPLPIAVGGTVVDPDTANFAAGSMVVSIGAGANSKDQLSVNNQGTGTGQIGTIGSVITYGGLTVGTFTGGNGLTPLTIHFNGNATPTVLTALLQNITFSTSSTNPVVGNRTITVTVNDGQKNGSAQVVVQVVKGVDVAPTITLPSTAINYAANAPPTLIAATATVTDPDTPVFTNGVLTVRVVGNGSAKDSLSVNTQGLGAGQIALVGKQIKYGGVTIGTLAGTPLNRFISLNSNATLAAVQALVQNITFASRGPYAQTGQRSIQFQLSDGQGGTSTPTLASVNVTGLSGTPVLALPSTPATFVIGRTGALIDRQATLTDAAATTFANGKLTVSLIGGGQTTDHLIVGNQGTGAGKIHTVGNRVYYGSTLIGTTSGGDGFNPLVVTLNAHANQTNTQALVRDITYTTLNSSPSTGSRLVQMQFNDGHGNISNTATQTVNLVQDIPPTIGLSSSSTFYSNNSIPEIIDPLATITDTNNANYNGGNLTVSITSGATGADRLSIQNQGTGANQIGFIGGTVTFGGVVIGTASGGTGTQPLVITLNGNATPTTTQALLDAITYGTVGNTSTTDRTIQFQITDELGGLSNAPSVKMFVV